MKKASFGALLVVFAVFFAACNGDGGSSSCSSKEDCPSGQTCNDSGQCVPGCENDSDCPDGYCGEGVCRDDQCSSDSDCIGQNICDGTFCRTGCRNDSACPDDEECNQIGHYCESTSCTPDSCGTHQICDEESGACRYDGSCQQQGSGTCAAYQRQLDDGKEYICSEEQGECIVRPPCGSDQDCERDEICNIRENERNICQEGCRTGNDCDIDEYCNESNKCVTGCSSNEDCSNVGAPDTDYYCHNLRCVPGCDTRDDCSEPGKVCLGSPRICQDCTDDSQCAITEECDLTKGATPDSGRCTDLPPPCPEDQYEDNQSAESPYQIEETPFEPTGDNRPILCRNHQSGEWYAVDAEAGQVLDIVLNYESAGNVDLALWRDAETEIVASNRRPREDNGTERIQYGVEESGTFLVQIRGGITEEEQNIRLDIKIDARSPQDCEDDGLEPNNSVDAAQALDAETQFSDLEVCGDDSDFYSLDVDQGKITAVAEAPIRLGNVDLVLYDSDGEQLTEANQRANKETLIYEAQESGPYILEVKAANGTGRIEYDLSWRRDQIICSDRFDPNDVCPSETSSIEAGTYSNLNVCTDNDYYAIELLPRESLTATATYDPIENGGELRLTLFGPNSCLNVISSGTLKEVEDSTERQLIINHEAETGGTFYLRADKFQGTRVPYSLELETTSGPACEDDSFEPNNGTSNATEISRSGVLDGTESTLLDLKICDEDADWYQVDLQSGDELEWVTTFSNSEGNIDIQLLDSDGSTVIDEGTSSTDNETVSTTASSVGTYYLKVEGKVPVRTDYRLLTYINGNGPDKQSCPDRFEVNDECSSGGVCQAATVSPGSYSNLLLCGGSGNTDADTDWYKTDIEAGETINVDLSFNNADGDLNLRLFDERIGPFVDRSATRQDSESVSYKSFRDQTMYYRVNTIDPQLEANTYTMDVGIEEATSCEDDSYEPNDSPSNATSVTAPGLYPRLKKCEDDVDWYKVDLQSGQKVEFFSNHDATKADINLEVYDSPDASSPIKTADSSDNDESLVFTPSSSGTHYIKVQTKSRARLAYDFLLYRDQNGNGEIELGSEGPADRACPDKLENNDSRTEATAITTGQTQNLSLCWGSPFDTDFYEIFVPSEVTMNVDLTFDNADGNIDLNVYEKGSFNPTTSSETATSNESISFQNSGKGKNYIIEVTGAGGNFRNNYTMDVELDFSTAPSCSDDSNSTGSKSSAPELSTGTYDNMLCEGTEDFMKLPISSGDDVTVHLDQESRLGNVEIQLIDDSGSDPSVIAETDSTDDKKTIDTSVSSGGPFYLKAYPADNAKIRNAYDLWVSLAGNTPNLPYCSDDYERNDTRDTYTDISLRDTTNNYAGQFTDMDACGAEADWYRATLSSGETYNLDVFFDNDNLDISLELRDSSGNVFDDINGQSIEFSRQKSSQDEITAFEVNSTENYFIGVKNKGSATSNGSYYLNLTKRNSSNTLHCPEDSYEINDSASTAESITPDPNELPIEKGLGACGSPDYFLWEAPSNQEVSAKLMMNNAFVNLAIEVKRINDDGTKTTVAADQGLTTPTDDNRATATFDASQGTTYLIEITRGKINDTVKNGPYFLLIE